VALRAILESEQKKSKENKTEIENMRLQICDLKSEIATLKLLLDDMEVYIYKLIIPTTLYAIFSQY